MMAIVALLLAIAACCLAAPAAAWAGEVDLGISLSRGEAQETASGATGSLDLGIALGTGAAEFDDDASDGAVDIGIMLGAAQHSEVRFAGYYCDEGGSVVGAMETLPEVQRVAAGGRAAEPANTRRTYEEGGSTVEYWLDGWYAADPSLHPDARPQALSDIEIDGDTVLYCLWKKGYVVKLDPNNGDDGSGKPVFDGSVSPGHVSVQRNPEYDEKLADGGTLPDDLGDEYKVDYKDFPVPVRAGYVFAGWYDPETENGDIAVDWTQQGHGRVKLKGNAVVGAPVAEQTGTMRYEDFYRAFQDGGRTLYAKWDLDPGVEVRLAGARDGSNAEVGLSVWYWPGRGYTLARPAADMEIDPKAAIAAEAGPVALGVQRNPIPDYPTQYFTGWGHASNGGTTFVSCEKDEATGMYSYAFTEAAFDGPCVRDGKWVDAAHTVAGDDGARSTTWDALFGTAPIRVSAPFEVTFDVENADDPAHPKPYPLDKLEYVAGKQERIYSSPKEFKNYGDQAVFISGIDCLDVGASAILPGGAGGAKIFSLGAEKGSFGDASSIRFGYAAASGANRVALGAYDQQRYERGEYLVLPAAANEDAPGKANLRYGLDLAGARFNSAAIAVGDDPANSSYIAKIANVKYTYSVVP